MYDRDAIIAAVDLRAIADELLGPHAGSERSPTWSCPNPQHAQTGRTPPVNVFTSRRGEQRWRCHGCGAGGTAIDLVMVCRGSDVREALDELASLAGQQPVPPGTIPRPPGRRADARPATPVGCRDPEGLTEYVEDCARALWQIQGRSVRQWLMEERRLSETVLLANRVGADLGPGRQGRPSGMPRTAGAVLPVLADGRAVYAQLRVIDPRPDRPRYLNPSADLAPNPRLARFEPAECEHPEILITEGSMDALSATAAGYRAVAVLSAGYPDRAVAQSLSRLPHPLVIAFDADDAGKKGADQLAKLLTALQRPPVVLDLEQGDVNDALVHADAWEISLTNRVEAAAKTSASQACPTHPC